MITVRKMMLEDIDGVMKIDNESFSVPWSRETFLLEIGSPVSSYLVAVNEAGLILGYGGFYMILDQVEITNIAVGCEFRGQGIGKLLLEGLLKLAIVARALVVNLDVRESNVAAKALYNSFGFKEVGRRKGYYQKPEEDSLLLSLDLEEGRLND